MAGDEETAVVRTLDGEYARLLRDGQQFKLRDLLDVLQPVFGVAGVRDIEHIVKAAEEGGLGADHRVGEHAEELFAQIILRDPIVVEEAGLGPPADVQCGVDMGGGPVHDLAQLVPVVHIGEVQILHRRAGDDHAIELPVLDLVEGGVEGGEMVGVRILGDVAQGVEQFHLDLEGGVGQLAQQLGLRDDLSGHQVEDQQVQWADVLVHGPVFRHHKDILALQRRSGRERVRDLDGHGKDLFPI